jgi:hypothetical protein
MDRSLVFRRHSPYPERGGRRRDKGRGARRRKRGPGAKLGRFTPPLHADEPGRHASKNKYRAKG